MISIHFNLEGRSMNKQRLECERLIYKIMEILDDPKSNKDESPNVDFWVRQFAKMNDKQFEEFILKPFSIYYQTSGLKREPKINQLTQALDELKVPLMEEIYMPHKYKNSQDKPVKSKKCLVLYLHMKRMKQLLTKKNGMSIEAKTRDARTGLLTGYDKNGRESDREFESLAISGLTATMKELSRSRADSMNDKSLMNSTIKTMGQVRLEDLTNDPTDSLSKNLLNVYFIGAGLMSNIVTKDYMTPYTLQQKNMKVSRDG